MARLLLIRHATTAETGKRLSGRRPGLALDGRGREAAATLAAALATAGPAAVYTSPLRRCRETARILAAPHGLTPVPHHGLIEVDYGAWAGRTLGSLRRTALWRVLLTAPSRARFPQGESLAEVQARAVAACEALAASRGETTILLVSHGDVIAAAVAHYLGTPPDLFRRIIISPASVSTVDLPDGAPPRVMAVNVTVGAF